MHLVISGRLRVELLTAPTPELLFWLIGEHLLLVLLLLVQLTDAVQVVFVRW